MLLLPETDVLGDGGARMSAKLCNERALVAHGNCPGTTRTGAGSPRARLHQAPNVLFDSGQSNLKGPRGLGLRHHLANCPDDAFTQIVRVSFHPSSVLPAEPFRPLLWGPACLLDHAENLTQTAARLRTREMSPVFLFVVVRHPLRVARLAFLLRRGFRDVPVSHAVLDVEVGPDVRLQGLALVDLLYLDALGGTDLVGIVGFEDTATEE